MSSARGLASWWRLLKGPSLLALFAAVMLLAVVAAITLPGGAGAQAQQQADPPAVDVQLFVAPSIVTLGDRVRVTVEVTHPDDLLLTADEPDRREGLTLVETVAPTSRPGSLPGELITEFGFTFAAFSLGRLDPPVVRLAWLRSDGSSGVLTEQPPPFEVRSTITSPDPSLRPLKPQFDPGGGALPWRWPASFAAGILALGIGAAWLRRRDRSAASEPLLVPVASTPEAASRRRLEALEAHALLAQGDFQRFYGELSTIVREYLESRFAFSARALTTRQLERRMAGEGVERWQARLVSGLLDRCDTAIYAHSYPDSASADHDLTVAFEIIDLTRAGRLDVAGGAAGGAAE